MFRRKKELELKKQYLIELQKCKDVLDMEKEVLEIECEELKKQNKDYINELIRIKKQLKESNEKVKKLKAKYEEVYGYLTPKKRELFDEKHK